MLIICSRIRIVTNRKSVVLTGKRLVSYCDCIRSPG